MEGFKNTLEVFGSNSLAIILDSELNAFALGWVTDNVTFQINVRIVLGKFDGVAEQVVQDLLHALAISLVVLRHICSNVGSDPQSSPSRIGLHLNGRRDTIQRTLQIHVGTNIEIKITRGQFAVIQEREASLEAFRKTT